jgi:chorismate synthase
MLRYFTSGESHGEGWSRSFPAPAGLAIDQEFVDREHWRAPQGFARRSNEDRAIALSISGVRHGKNHRVDLDDAPNATGRIGKSRL